MRFLLRCLSVVISCLVILALVGITSLIAKKLWPGKGGSGRHSSGYVAVVDISGVMLRSGSVLKKFRKSFDDDSNAAKAADIYFRINSPGGFGPPVSRNLQKAF